MADKTTAPMPPRLLPLALLACVAVLPVPAVADGGAEFNHGGDTLRQPGAGEREVLAAAARNEWPAVLRALKAGTAPAATAAADGTTLLALAAGTHAAQHPAALDTLRWLLAHGAQPERRGPGGYSALAWAVLRGQAEAARALLRAGADPHNPGGAPQPPLHWAAQLGQLGVLRVLLQAGADPLALNDRKQNALHVAFMNGQHEATDLLAPSTAAALADAGR